MNEDSPAPGPFHMPAKKDFMSLTAIMKLSAEQAFALEEVLREVDADLRNYRAIMRDRPDRPEMLANLKKMLKLASALRDEIERHKTELLDFLPQEGLRRMAALLTFSAISQARDKDTFPRSFEADMAFLEKRQNGKPDLADIEAHYREMRADFGLTNSGDILVHFLGTLIGPMEALIEINRHNPGGRPISAERRYLIGYLALAAPRILGEEATASLTGRFVDLCEQVAVTCGLSADGIDKAAVAVVREVAERRDGQKP